MFFFCEAIYHSLGLIIHVSCIGVRVQVGHVVCQTESWMSVLSCTVRIHSQSLQRACLMSDSCLYLENLALAVCYEFYLSAYINYSL